MKIKNAIFVNGTLDILSKLLDEKDLTMGQKYSLVKLVKQIEEKGKTFNELRQKLFTELGEEFEEDGKKMQRIKPENIDEYGKKLQEISDIEEEYDFTAITVSGDAKLAISTKDLILLEQFITVS